MQIDLPHLLSEARRYLATSEPDLKASDPDLLAQLDRRLSEFARLSASALCTLTLDDARALAVILEAFACALSEHGPRELEDEDEDEDEAEAAAVAAAAAGGSLRLIARAQGQPLPRAA